MLLRVRDVIQNGHQDGRHLGFYPKFKFIGKTRNLQIRYARAVKKIQLNILLLLVAFYKL